MDNIDKYAYGCKFPGCQNKYYTGITKEGYKNKRFFKFPTNETRRTTWLKICKIDPKNFFKNTYVCEDHFLPQDYFNYRMERLQHSAVPKDLPLKGATSSSSNNVQTNDVTDYNYINTSIYHKDKFSFLLEDNRSLWFRTSPDPHMLTYRSALSKMMTLKNALGVEGNHMEKIKQLYEDGKFKNIEEELCTLPQGLIDSQLKIVPQQPSVKRWSLDDEIFALWLYVRMPCLYKYMSTMFQFPSERKLDYLFSRITFGTAYNNILMEQLKIQNETLNTVDRNCLLLFGDIELSKKLDYDPYQQLIWGFEDIGQCGTSNKEAGYALVFMIKGIRLPWEQVIAYYFLSKPIQNCTLQNILVKIIKDLQETGFNIVGTVCDLKQNYIELLKMLCGEDTFFRVNSAPVYTFFDVPHLLKDTRDALLCCNIEFEQGKIAKFAYIEKAFNLDRERRTYSQLPQIKPEHFKFEDDQIRRNLSIAAAQLNHLVACSIESWIWLEQLPADAIHTAEFAVYVENIFDSLSESKREAPTGRQYLCAVSSSTPHVALWSQSLKTIPNWKFIDTNTNEDVTKEYSFVHGWITSITSMMCLWKEMRQVGFDYLSLDVYNTKPLNSLLDTIREHYTFPSCRQFVAAFKTDIIQSFSESNKYMCMPLVKPRDFLIDAGPTFETCEQFLYIDIDLSTMDEYEATAYVAGYILKQIAFSVFCKVCCGNIFAIDLLPNEANIDLRLYASDLTIRFVDTIKCLLYAFLNCYAHLQLPVEDTFKRTYKSELDMKFCPQHNYEDFIRDQSVRIFICEWVKWRKNSCKYLYSFAL